MGKVSDKPQVTHTVVVAFCSMKLLGIFLLPPLDGMLVHHRVTPQYFVTITHLYTLVERQPEVKFLVLVSNSMTAETMQTSNHPPLDQKSNVLTTRQD